MIAIFIIGFLVGWGWHRWSSGWGDLIAEAYQAGYEDGKREVGA